MRQVLHSLFLPNGSILDVMDLPSALLSMADYDAVISLLDPGMAVDFPAHPCHRVFAIRDVMTAQGASPETIREILDLHLSHVPRMLIHCEVGVSRSPAVAMLLAARWGAEDETILSGMDWARACPNRRILELGETILGMPGRFTSLLEQAKNQAASGPSETHPKRTGEAEARSCCDFCGVELTESDQHMAAILDRFLSLVLKDRQIRVSKACPACTERYTSEPPPGFGAEGWRNTLGTHAAAFLVQFLGNNPSREEIETLGMSQLIFLNLLNSASDDDLQAAQEQAERCMPFFLDETAAEPEAESPARHRIHLPGGRIIEVRGLPEALKIYRDFDAVISLLDPWADIAWEPHPRHWIFRVRDVEGEAEHAPDRAFVEALLTLDFGEARQILIHCHEGFSRSTATAILQATRLGAAPEAILEGIDWTHAYPNQRILAFGEEILDTGSRLQALVEDGLKRGGWR